MSLDEYRETLFEIGDEWNEAERDIKLGEQVNRKVVFPAIKELRYAGRRLSDAMTAIAKDKDSKKINEFLSDARFNCHCARHDVIDAATTKMILDLDIMERRLGFDAVLAAFPKFGQFYSAVQDAQEKIALARRKRENRQDIYSEIEKINFPDLVTVYNSLKSSEPLMKRIAARNKFTRWISYVLAIISILVSLTLWFFPRTT